MGTGELEGKPNKLRGIDLRWTSIPSKGSRNTPSHFMPPGLIERIGYESRQTSKEQTKMARFMIEGPRPCIIFCFAFIHCA